MTKEIFFEKFDLFAGTPDAITKMRELIMWSAFSGAFSSEKRSLPMPEGWAVEGAPTLPSIPSSWKWQRGGEVFHVIRGVSYKKSDASEVPVVGSFPLLRANNIGNGINFDDLVYVPLNNIRPEQFVRCGDILIAMSSGSKRLVGKAAPIVTDFKGAFGAFCGLIRNKSGILDGVLARYLQSPQYTAWVTAAGRGIGINNLGKGDLDSLPIPTPPLTEQEQIVTKINELMALCDRLEAQQQERETRHAALVRASLARVADAPTPSNLNFLFHPSYIIPPAELRKLVLELAIKGKLVPQDRRDGSAKTQLMENLEKSRSNRKVTHNNETGNSIIAPIMDPWEIPDSWLWVGLSSACHTITDGEHLTPAYSAEGVPMLSAKHIGTAELLWDDFKYVSGVVAEKCWSRCKPEIGDILVVSRGGGIGRSIVSDREGFCLMGSVLLLKTHSNVFSEYLNLYLNSEYGNAKLRATSGASAQQAIYIAHLRRDYILPLPPLAEQHRIVTKVKQLIALVNQLEMQLAHSSAAAEELMKAVIAELTT